MLRDQLVAAAVHREDVPRVLLVFLELPPELDDELVDRAVGSGPAVGAPHLVEHLGASWRRSGPRSSAAESPSPPWPRASTASPTTSRASRTPRTRSGSSSITRIFFWVSRTAVATTATCITESGLPRLHDRHPDAEGRAAPGLARHRRVAAVRARDVLHQRQTDARSADRLEPDRPRPI